MYSANDNILVSETRLSEDQKRAIATVMIGITIISLKAKANNGTLDEEDYNALTAMGQICATFMTRDEAQKVYAAIRAKRAKRANIASSDGT